MVVLKKKVVKKAVKAEKKVKRISIASVMRELLGKDINVPYAQVIAAVKKINPKSRFNEAHLAWYKSQVARGKMKGMK